MIRSRSASEFILFWLLRFSAAIAVVILLAVLILLYRSGHAVLSWQFLVGAWQQQDITKGGIFPAIIGSLYLGLGVLVVSVPLGVATAVFLTEYAHASLWKRIIQLAIRNLAGVPSVVYGLFGLAVFVQILNFKMSLLSAVLTLSVMTLPWIITASVEALTAVPRRFRESGSWRNALANHFPHHSSFCTARVSYRWHHWRCARAWRNGPHHSCWCNVLPHQLATFSIRPVHGTAVPYLYPRNAACESIRSGIRCRHGIRSYFAHLYP